MFTTAARQGHTAEHDSEGAAGAGAALAGLFQVLERAGIRYCVLHGYATYPETVPSDVDCLVDSSVTPAALVALLHRERQFIGAEVIFCRGYHIVLAGKNTDGSPNLLNMDFSVDCAVGSLKVLSGREVLAARRSYRGFWTMPARMEFAWYLAKNMLAASLSPDRCRRLSELYLADPAGCAAEVRRLLSEADAQTVMLAASEGRWHGVWEQQYRLSQQLRQRLGHVSPIRVVRDHARRLVSFVGRIRHPDGLSIAVLGPDGAGKSSLIDALGPALAAVLSRQSTRGFAPEIVQRLRHGRHRSTSTPHALAPRSALVSSLLAVGYWLSFNVLSYPFVRIEMARGALIAYDRHFVDVLVDPKRYRYGGPAWLVDLIWRVIPKPTLVVLLDAPVEVLRQRKQEVSLEEIVRQRSAYSNLVEGLRQGYIVNASQPRQMVIDQVRSIALEYMNSRVLRRFGLA